MASLLGRILITEKGFPVSQYLCRREELFSMEDEYYWLADMGKAWRFEASGAKSGEEVAREFKASRVWLDAEGKPDVVWVLPCGGTAAELSAPAAKRDARAGDCLGRHLREGTDAAEVYAATQKRMGEHD